MIIAYLFAFRTIGLREPDASSEGESQNFPRRQEQIFQHHRANYTIQ